MLVAIEGIDGAGKNTQTDLLVARARRSGLRATSLSFPRYTHTFFGAQIRDLLKGNFGDGNDPRLIGLLFAGDRLQSLPGLLDDLAHHDLVVVDRYVGSNLAYQSAREPEHARQSVIDWLSEVEFEVYGLPRADLNVLLDIPEDVAAERLAGRGEHGGRVRNDVFESDLDYLARCRETYLMLAGDRADWAVVDVTHERRVLEPDEIADRVWALVSERR